VDLGRTLTGTPCRQAGDSRVAILDVDGLRLGVRVDAAVDVISVLGERLEPPPALATQAGYDAVKAVVRREGQAPVLVLSTDHLLECVYRSALAGEGKAA